MATKCVLCCTALASFPVLVSLLGYILTNYLSLSCFLIFVYCVILIAAYILHNQFDVPVACEVGCLQSSSPSGCDKRQ